MKKFYTFLLLVIIIFSFKYFHWIEYAFHGIVFGGKHLFQRTFHRTQISKNQESLLENLKTEQAKKNLLLVPQIKNFGEKVYNFKNTKSFEDYVELKNNQIGWQFTAAHPYKFQEINFINIPFLLKLSYIGFFDKNLVKKWEKMYKKKGYDTYVSQIKGYSTLGILKDPLFSSYLYSTDTYSFVHLLLHEMAHEKLYILTDMNLSEQLAEYISKKAVQKFFKEILKEPIEDLEHEKYTEKMKKENKLFLRIVNKYKKKLEILYSQNITIEKKALKKKKIYKQLQKALKKKKKSFKILHSAHYLAEREELNNAVMMNYFFYQMIPTKNSFSKLFNDFCNQEFECFFYEIKNLKSCSNFIRTMFLNKEKRMEFFLTKMQYLEYIIL